MMLRPHQVKKDLIIGKIIISEESLDTPQVVGKSITALTAIKEHSANDYQ